MKVQVNNKVLIVKWKHIAPENKIYSDKLKKKDKSFLYNNRYINGSTECLIKDVENPEVSIYSGHTYCSPLDQFNKQKGRIVSLTKAIKHLPKDVRTQFWLSYKREIGF